MSDSAEIKTLTVQNVSFLEEEEDDERDDLVHRVIYVGQIAAGDLDGDRRDEIAIAGYTGEIHVDEKGEFKDGRYEFDTENIALCYAKWDGGRYGISGITVDAMTPFIEEGFFCGDDQMLVPL